VHASSIHTWEDNYYSNDAAEALTSQAFLADIDTINERRVVDSQTDIPNGSLFFVRNISRQEQHAEVLRDSWSDNNCSCLPRHWAGRGRQELLLSLQESRSTSACCSCQEMFRTKNRLPSFQKPEGLPSPGSDEGLMSFDAVDDFDGVAILYFVGGEIGMGRVRGAECFAAAGCFLLGGSFMFSSSLPLFEVLRQVVMMTSVAFDRVVSKASMYVCLVNCCDMVACNRDFHFLVLKGDPLKNGQHLSGSKLLLPMEGKLLYLLTGRIHKRVLEVNRGDYDLSVS
jgi:hypothetical protein